jgi:hypothetical protein
LTAGITPRFWIWHFAPSSGIVIRISSCKCMSKCRHPFFARNRLLPLSHVSVALPAQPVLDQRRCRYPVSNVHRAKDDRGPANGKIGRNHTSNSERILVHQTVKRIESKRKLRNGYPIHPVGSTGTPVIPLRPLPGPFGFTPVTVGVMAGWAASNPPTPASPQHSFSVTSSISRASMRLAIATPRLSAAL